MEVSLSSDDSACFTSQKIAWKFITHTYNYDTGGERNNKRNHTFGVKCFKIFFINSRLNLYLIVDFSFIVKLQSLTLISCSGSKNRLIFENTYHYKKVPYKIINFQNSWNGEEQNKLVETLHVVFQTKSSK